MKGSQRKSIPNENYTKTVTELAEEYNAFEHGYIDDFIPTEKKRDFIAESAKNALNKLIKPNKPL